MDMNCCKKPSRITMDYCRSPLRADPMVNRHCNACGAHWFGPPGEVKQFTRADWDKWISEDDNG